MVFFKAPLDEAVKYEEEDFCACLTGKLAALKVAKGKSMKIRHLRDAALRGKKKS